MCAPRPTLCMGHQLGRHPRPSSSPAASRSASSLRDRCRQSSTAKLRSRAKPIGPANELQVGHRSSLRWSSSHRACARPRRSPPPCACACAHRSPRSPSPVYLSPRRASGTGRWAHLSGGEATLLSGPRPAGFVCPRGGKSHGVHVGHRASELTPRTSASMTLRSTSLARCLSLGRGAMSSPGTLKRPFEPEAGGALLPGDVLTRGVPAFASGIRTKTGHPDKEG